jgi:hypothetical protein
MKKSNLITFFKKPIVRTISIITVAFMLSVVTNSYYREIQEKIHEGIGWVYEKE